MRKQLFLLAIGLGTISNLIYADSVSWLPKEGTAKSTIRLLECSYDKAQLVKAEEITSASSDWDVSLAGEPEGHATLTARNMCMSTLSRRNVPCNRQVWLSLSTAITGAVTNHVEFKALGNKESIVMK